MAHNPFRTTESTAADAAYSERPHDSPDVDDSIIRDVEEIGSSRLKDLAYYSVVISLILTTAYIGWLFLDSSGERENMSSSPGDFYADYLGSDYDTVLVEIDYVQGYRPTDDALDHFRNVMLRETQKDVDIKIDDEIASSGSTYSLSKINSLEKKHRDEYRSGDTAVMYYLYLDGGYAASSTVLGVSYHGSSVALFKEKMDGAAEGTISPMEIERAVLVHEAGHLFGLVEINYRSDHDHNDPDHPHHSTHTDAAGHHDCVMYWAIESTNIVGFDSYYNQAVGDIPNDFAEYCRDDLQKQRDRAD